MSESVITQCPHCSTSFRVNDAQLGAANGAVRCGTCLKVFNALNSRFLSSYSWKTSGTCAWRSARAGG
ncbi:MJ0042-type zinc finger domain-containing protein, partial [Pseudomonas aeruginosa]|uniref:MJ0042-type zinc finger domain-containing protein n=1 Tax=Pseudomonas aeruginosa TaxID=287 RepID=UPI00211C47F2